MSYETGKKKTGGRKSGTPNKRTLALIEVLEAKNLDPVEEITKLLPALEPKQQVDVHLELMGYIYPKRKAVEALPEPEKPFLGDVPITRELIHDLVARARKIKDSGSAAGSEP